MSCIEFIKSRGRWLGLGLAALLGGCGNGSAPPGGAPAAPAAPAVSPGTAAATGGAPAGNAAATQARPTLGPPKAVGSHEELRHQAALRLVAANPEHSYMGEVPAVLMAIPVLEVELHADGRVKRVQVLRRPGQAQETVQMAIDAVHRAAPFGDVRHLPPPWRFTETFLFNDEHRFKPRSLDD
ncbi:MAG: hypothetical protein ABW005_04615 [Burkholderiaceae bacterium]